MNKGKNQIFICIFLLLSLSLFLRTGEFTGIPIQKSQSNLTLNIDSFQEESLPTMKSSMLDSKADFFIPRNFSYNLSWDNSQIILTESITINSSTDLQIHNSTIFINPVSSDTHVSVFIDEESRLNITDSYIAVISGFGSINFYGIDAYITNSTIIGLGEYWDSPGFNFNCDIISILNSTFVSGFSGVSFSNSIYVELSNCTFQDINGIGGYGGLGVYGFDSTNINVSECTFLDVRSCLNLYYCGSISLSDNKLLNARSGVIINPNGRYSDTYNVQITNNVFDNNLVGVQLVGSNVEIIGNKFLNMSITGLYIGGRDITILSNIFKYSSRGILTPESLPSSEQNQPVSSSISDAYIKGNIFENMSSYCIQISNYEYPTVFSISENNFTNIEVGIGFEGNIGGIDSIDRSWVTKNIFQNISEHAIEGFPLDYLAHFQYTSFVQNAFLSCKNEYTSFQANYYYMDDIRWDDGFVGNYWESNIDESQDEDNNSIGDIFFIVSVDHGQYDLAPLLSMIYLQQESITVSDHPSDLVRAKSELKGENATFTWNIRSENNWNVTIHQDGLLVQSNQNVSTMNASLLSLSLGLHNFTLVISSENQSYRDLVWVRILEDKSDFIADILVPIGAGIFLIAILIVSVLSIKKMYS